MMTDAWDGRPQNPERDGWHWVAGIPRFWVADYSMWEGVGGYSVPPGVWRHMNYGGPCLTPAEVAAERAADWCAGRDAVVALAQQRAELMSRGQDPGSAGYANGCDDVAIFGEALTPPAADASALTAMLAQAEHRGVMRAAEIAITLAVKHATDRAGMDLAEQIAVALRAAGENAA